MFDGIFEFLTHLFNGGSEAVITILVCIIAFLLWEIKRLRENEKSREEKLDKIVDDYHKGNLTIAEAMNSLRYVLAEVKGRIG